MKYYLAKIGRKILTFVFKHRLGRHNWSAKFLFWLIGQFDRFEVYENTNDTGNKDHYVPKLLLRNFRIAESGTDKGKVWEFSFKRNSVEKADINSVAAQIDFYTYKDKGGAKSDYIEKKLFSQTLERFGSMVINRLKETTGEPDLTYLEESTLAVFIAHQITRVPSFYTAIEKFIVFLYLNGQLKISDLGEMDFLRSKIARNEIGVSLDDLMAFDSKIHIDGAKNHIGILSTLIATEMAERIYRGNLHVLDIPQGSNDQFVISDNPIVLLDFDRSEILRYPAWWTINKESIWVFFPISPTRCIFYCKSKRKDSVVEKENNDLPQLINFGQYLNASDSVFSQDENVPKVHLKLYAKELLNLRLN
jgi:hypothetical protein